MCWDLCDVWIGCVSFAGNLAVCLFVCLLISMNLVFSVGVALRCFECRFAGFPVYCICCFVILMGRCPTLVFGLM